MQELLPKHLKFWRVALPFILVTLIWSTTWIIIKTQLGVVPPQWSVVYRFAGACFIMFVACLVMRRQIAFPWQAHLFFIALGLFQFASNFNLVYQASRFVTSGLIAVAFALLVVPNAIFARIFLGQKFSLQFVAGSVLGIVGITLLFREELLGVEMGSGFLIGIAATALSVICASIANVMQATPRARSYDIFGMLAWSMLYGVALDVGIAWSTAGPPVFEPTLGYIAGLFYLSAFASALAFLLYFSVIRIIGPAKAAYSSVLIPFIAMAISTYAEGFHWTLVSIVGGMLAMIGLVIALQSRNVPAGAAAAGGTTGRS